MFKFSNSDGTNLSKMDDLDIIKFLRLCRKEPVIWNTSHSHYNQGIHRLAASERISAALNLRNFAAMHVVGEFDRLRSVYGEELRKVLQMEDYETKVVWFDTMDSFMRPFVQQWNSEGSLCSGGVQEERANKMGIEYNDDVPCDVCRSPFCEEKNEMVFCDSCDVCVHQACYGVTTIPEGNWYCRPCELNLKPSCVLCPNKGGAMKMTSNGFDWAHVSCAWWIKEVNIGCPEKMEPITNISSIPGSRWALMCSLCRVKFGACIQCAETHCTIAYHVTCAFEGGLRMEMEETDSSDDGVKLRSFCQTHRNNSMKSRKKSKKRKMESDSEDSDELKFSLRAPTQFQKKNGKNVKSRLRDIDNQETEDSLDFGEQNSEDDLPSLSGAGHQKTHSDKAHLTQPVTLHDIFGGPKSRGETSLRRFMYGLRPLPNIPSGIKLSNGITEKESTKIPNSLLKSRHGGISKTKTARKKSSEKYSSKGRRRSTLNQSVGTQKGRSTSRDRKPPPKPKDDASSCCESPSTENRHQICCCNQTLLTQNVQWTSFDCQQFAAQDRYQECCCNHSLTIQNGLSVCCGGKPPTVQNTLKACCNQTHLNHTANQMSHCSQLLPTQIGHRESCCNRPLATQNGYWASFYPNPPKTQEVYQEFCGNQPPTIDIEHQLSCDYQSSVNPASYRNQPPETEIEHHTPCGNQPQRIKIEKQTSCDYQLLATPIKHPTSFRNQSPAIPIENQTSIKHQTSFGKQAPATKIGNESIFGDLPPAAELEHQTTCGEKSIFGDLPPAAELEHQTTSTQNEYRTSCASADTNVTKAQMAENGGVKRKETDTELESVHDPDDVFSLPSVEEMILNNSIPVKTVEQNSEQSPKKYEGDTQFWKSVNCFLGSLPPENADKLKKEIISLCIKTRVQYISDAKVNRSESESD